MCINIHTVSESRTRTSTKVNVQTLINNIFKSAHHEQTVERAERKKRENIKKSQELIVSLPACPFSERKLNKPCKQKKYKNIQTFAWILIKYMAWKRKLQNQQLARTMCSFTSHVRITINSSLYKQGINGGPSKGVFFFSFGCLLFLPESMKNVLKGCHQGFRK